MSRQDFTVFGTASEFTELVAVVKEQARREVLADLRDKVRLIPAHAVRMENKWMNGRGWVPTTETIYTVPLAAVLALIEEADNA